MNRTETLQLLKAHKAKLARDFGVTNLALFGSVSRDDAGPGSDIDILVVFDGPATSKRYSPALTGSSVLTAKASSTCLIGTNPSASPKPMSRRLLTRYYRLLKYTVQLIELSRLATFAMCLPTLKRETLSMPTRHTPDGTWITLIRGQMRTRKLWQPDWLRCPAIFWSRHGTATNSGRILLSRGSGADRPLLLPREDTSTMWDPLKTCDIPWSKHSLPISG